MKTSTTHISDIFSRWTRLLSVPLCAGLMVALMMPAAAVSQSPAPVNLGTAGDFVILAKTGISTTGVTAITGDIGLSPAAATFITGFGLILDASNTFSTSSLVTGKVYAADYTPPTPAKMTTAISDMETAYTDAAGRPTPNFTELGAGNITSLTLAPGLYKWGTGVSIDGAGVTISGSPSDVWIFQIAGNLTVANGAIVTLSGGAQASNIFWQVAGQVTLGTTAQMKGIILCQTLIAMNTGATLIGRALAQSAVTLDANTVTSVPPIGPFAKLQLLVPGETAAPGTGTGKTGTPTARTAGASFTVTVNAVDANWNVVNTVTDVVRITSSDVNATLPVSAALVAGTKNFSVTLNTPGSRTVTATDTTDGTKTANTSPAITVNAGAFTKLQLLVPGETAAPSTATGKTGTPTARTAGTSFTVTVNAVDASWNLINTVTDVVGITSSDVNATLPVSVALVAGTKDFSVTLKTAGSRTVTATDTTDGTKTANTSPSITVNASAFTKLQLLVPGETAAPGTGTGKTGTPTARTAGTSFTVTVNAVDANWNVVNTVTDVVRITSSDVNATLPVSAAFVAGTKNFSVTLKTAGSRTVTATDTTDGTKTANTSPSITVNVGAAATFALTSGNNQSGVVGTTLANLFVATLRDAAGNLISGTAVTFAIATTPGPTTGHSLSVTNGTTNASGQASSTLTLGNNAGIYIVTATATGLSGSPVSFTATARAGAAAAISLFSGNNQSGLMQSTLAKLLVVRVADQNGNSVEGAGVAFAITSSPSGATGQSLSKTSTTSADDGFAWTTLTLGNKPGEYAVTATSSGLSGSPVVFTATATAAQLSINLGTAGDFVILAKTGISTTGVTAITGDIGISPAAATFITGFGLIMDASNTFSTSSLVTGKVYAPNYAAPTPAKMTTAVSNMETAYTDAAGRTLPNHTELGAGNITSMTLTPGLYKWGTGVLVSAAGVTLSGSATDVWIFQIAQNLTVANGAIVTLSGGAQAANIFWQVAGQVTLGTTAAMKGIILCQTAIVMNTGATLDGRALAQSAVTLDANTVISSTVGAAATIAQTSGNNQSAVISTTLANPFVVTVSDAGGNPVQGTSVTFAIATVPSGATGQVLSATNATTGVNGQASTVLTLGNRVGNYTVTATSTGLTGSPVTFTATANNPSPTVAGVSPNQAGRGSRLNVSITGTNFLTGVSSVSFGADITVNSQTVTSATRIDANISIASAATVGGRTVTVTNASPGGGIATLLSGFTVDTSVPTSVESLLGAIPQQYLLYDAYPNPFNPSTKIRFALPEHSSVRLEIYNMLGMLVGLAVDDELGAGTHEAIWKAENMPSGVYIVRMNARSLVSSTQFSSARRVALVK